MIGTNVRLRRVDEFMILILILKTKKLLTHYDTDFEELLEDIQHVLVNMCFNLGIDVLVIQDDVMLISRGSWKEMALQMEDSKWYGQVKKIS